MSENKLKAVSCPLCGMLHQYNSLSPGMVAECRRCGATIERHTVNGLQRTAAFSLAALVLYIPANILPILHFDLYGAVSDNTVWQGCVRLYEDGDPIVAAIVFLASIVIPLCKLLILFFLIVTTRQGSSRILKARTWMHRTVETIGRWAMLDVFIVAVLISLVKLKKLATILPGPGLLSFTAVVVFTILASASFDSSAIWREAEKEK